MNKKFTNSDWLALLDLNPPTENESIKDYLARMVNEKMLSENDVMDVRHHPKSDLDFISKKYIGFLAQGE